MKKILTLAGVLIIIATAVILFGGVFWLMQNANIKNQNDDVKIQNETAGWKTYQNDKHGFEIKYPSTWVEEEFPATYNVKSPDDDLYAVAFCAPRPSALTNCTGNPDQITIFIYHERFKNEDFIKDSIYLGSVRENDYENYYYLSNMSSVNRDLFSQIFSTFKFTK